MNESKRVAKISGMAIALWFLGGCSDSKVSQCNQLVSLANRVTQDFQALGKAAKSPADSIEQSSAKLGNYAQEMRSLSLKDPKLQDFQQRLVVQYTTLQTQTQDITTGTQRQDANQIQSAIDQVPNVIEQEGAIVKAVNTYCQAPEPK